jgi:hypothetical protein
MHLQHVRQSVHLPACGCKLCHATSSVDAAAVALSCCSSSTAAAAASWYTPLQIAGKYDAAKEGLLKLEDISGLLQLNVEELRWDDAFLLLAANSQLKDQVYVPYAKWLLSKDRCAVILCACLPKQCFAWFQSCTQQALVSHTREPGLQVLKNAAKSGMLPKSL